MAASLRQGCGGVAAEDLRGEVECAEVERAFVEILGRLEAAKVTQSVGLQDDCVRGGHTLFMPGSFLIFLGALTGLDTEGGRKAAIRYWIYSLLQDVLGRSWEEIVECRGRPHCGLESHDFPPGCRAEDIECAFSGRENNANANRRHQASLRTAVRAYRLKARG